MNKVIVPGTFDPITNGHLDIIERAAKLYDQVIVAVAKSAGKNPLFSLEERAELAKDSCLYLKNVEVKTFEGLLVDFAKENDAHIVVKGLRIVSDFEYEFQMAGLNRKLYPEFETLFMMSSHEYMHLSSSQIRELAQMGGEYEELVPECVAKALKNL